MRRMWIYHEQVRPIVINEDNYYLHIDYGWSETPLVDLRSFGINPDDELNVQMLGDTIRGMKEMLNGALNLDEMDKWELQGYAAEHFGIQFPEKYRAARMRKELRRMIDGDSKRFYH